MKPSHLLIHDSNHDKNANTFHNDFLSPNKLQFAIENRQLPSSPLDEIGFHSQMKSKSLRFDSDSSEASKVLDSSNDNSNDKDNDAEDNDITEQLLSTDSSGLDALDNLERRFSMISVESSATTGRLLDHLGLNDDEAGIDWTTYTDLGAIIGTSNSDSASTSTNSSSKSDLRPPVSKILPERHLLTPVATNVNQYQSLRVPSNGPATTLQQQKRSLNYAPLVKFPSLQHRFQKPQPSRPNEVTFGRTAGSGQVVQPGGATRMSAEVLESPGSGAGSPNLSSVPPPVPSKPVKTPVNHANSQPQQQLNVLRTPNLSPMSSPNLKFQQKSTGRVPQLASSPSPGSGSSRSSPFAIPMRKFAKDFSDQFEIVSPQRRGGSPFSKGRPRHTHSHSNPINILKTPQRLQQPLQSANSSGKTPQSASSSLASGTTISTPSPKQQQTLKRTPSTPVASKLDTKLIFAKPDEVAPETRVALALKLKLENQPQELSYQLQLAAEQGNKDAMLLYGLSLRYGYGVKKDDRQSFLWLCRSADIDLIRTYKFEIDPFELSESQIPKTAQEPLASTMLEIGRLYMMGLGVEKDENYGIQFIEKSASLGSVELMLELGNIWSTKGPHRKKNMHRSACWYRFADKFGKKLVGNSWIYKLKYMEKL